MTPSSEIAISPELLEAHFILRASPSWKEVQEARNRLKALAADGAQAYPKMETDRISVLQYAATLQRSADAVIFGMALATHLASFSPSDLPAQRLADGFQALSSGLDLLSLDEADTKAALERLVSEGLPELKIEPASLTTPAAWRSALDSALDQVRKLGPPDALATQRRAWGAWQARLLAYARRQPVVPPDIDYLRCRAEGSAPGTILRGRLQNLSVREWSEAYIAGVASNAAIKAPLWFGLGALAGQGFDLSPDITPTTAASQEESEAAVQFLQRVGTSNPKKGLIVVRLKAESISANWRVSTVPALTVTAEEYLSQAKAKVDDYFLARLHGVLIEVDQNQEPAEAQKQAIWPAIRKATPSVKIGFLMARPPDNTASVPSGSVYTVAPADAAAAAKAFLTTGSGTGPAA
jgi:hypothetical protein